MPLVRSAFVALLTAALISGCATIPKPLTGIVPGRKVETIQSSVSLSVHAADKSSGGRGVLVYRAPDQFHMAILSPFGLTLMEVFIAGEKVTWLFPGNSIAYQGTFDELPAHEGMESWKLMRWVVEDPPAGGPAKVREFVRKDGSREKVHFDSRGIIVMKENDRGDSVAYRDYQVINGIPFPEIIEIATRLGERVKITFDEPELNQSLEDGALSPNLTGVTLLPMSAFKGY